MGRVVTLALAAVLGFLVVQPALAQTPSGAMPPGAQNPAVAQPPFVAPPQPQLMQSPAPGPTPFQPGPTPNSPAPSALIGPDGAGGLCECLNSHDLSASVFDKTKLHQACMASPDACQAACNTQNLYSFVPHAVFSCPGRPGEAGGHVAMNTRPVLRRLSR